MREKLFGHIVVFNLTLDLIFDILEKVIPIFFLF